MSELTDGAEDTPTTSNEGDVLQAEPSLQETDPNEGNVDWKARALKAEEKIVSSKREAKKSKPNAEPNDYESIIEKKFIEREFYKENPEANELKDKIDEFVEKGVSHSDALFLLTRDNQEAQVNQQHANATVISWTVKTDSAEVTRDDLGKLSQSEYNVMRWKIDSGEVKLVG